jgi:hypothetical protein
MTISNDYKHRLLSLAATRVLLGMNLRHAGPRVIIEILSFCQIFDTIAEL